MFWGLCVMVDYLTKRPMLLCAVLSSVISVISFYSETALFVICLLLVAFIFFMIYKRVRGELIFAFILILAVSMSAVITSTHADKKSEADGSFCEGKFIVVEEPTCHGTFYAVTLETVESDVLESGDKVRVTYEDGSMEYAQKIKAGIQLNEVKEKYKSSNYAESVYINGYVKYMEYTGENDGVLGVVGSVREYIKDKIFGDYKREEAATMLALVTGDRSYFSDEFYSNVKGSGVSHVMVVSGMHLSIIVSFFLFLCNKFLYNRYLKAVVIFAVTIGVMAVCGFTMSILRAGLTYIFIAFSLVLGRENTPENSLGFAVTVILLLNPFAIFSVAFQLSALSTFAILAVASPIIETVCKKRFWGNFIVAPLFSSVVISVSTLLFTAPIAIYIFGYVSNVSIITNLLIGIATSVALVLCILGLCLPFLENILFILSEAIVRYINWVINYFGSLPFATMQLPSWTAFLVLGIIILVLCILLACKKRNDMLKLKEIRAKKIKEGGKKAICL